MQGRNIHNLQLHINNLQLPLLHVMLADARARLLTVKTSGDPSSFAADASNNAARCDQGWLSTKRESAVVHTQLLLLLQVLPTGGQGWVLTDKESAKNIRKCCCCQVVKGGLS